MEQMRADIDFRQAQKPTEWPKVFTAALVGVDAIVGAVFSVAGFIVGQNDHR